MLIALLDSEIPINPSTIFSLSHLSVLESPNIWNVAYES